MKKIISLVIPFALLFLTSCNDDPCKDVVCGVNAVCEEGSCKCVDGWEVDGDGDCTIQDFCFNVDCGTNGTCEQDNSGSWCECDEGYEFDADDKCNQEIRAKYIGTWVGTHQVNGTTSVSYTMTIAADSDVQKAIVTNVMNITCPVSGNPIEAVLSVALPFQSIISTCTSVNIGANGPGVLGLINENTLQMSVGANPNGNNESYTGIYTRQ